MTTFCSDQLLATKAFVQTMIVVDDEAQTQPKKEETVVAAVKPTRRSISKTTTDNNSISTPLISHPLNAKVLVDKALEQGLVCSVVTPTKEERKVPDRVSKAAKWADIVSLDWQMNNNDDGALAVQIVSRILNNDFEDGGRLRLISIYTGQRNTDGILKEIINKLPDKLKEDSGIEKDRDQINSKFGLKLIVLLKGEEINLKGEEINGNVKIEELPSRLLSEFSELSDGMLSNVALATIAEIRRTTHHLIRKFNEDMDAQYLHHQCLIEEPAKAKEYATRLILSEVKSEIDTTKIGSEFLSEGNVKKWLDRRFKTKTGLKLSYRNRNSEIEANDVEMNEVHSMLFNGFNCYYPKRKRPQLDNSEKYKWANWPKDQDVVKQSLGSIFFDSYERFEQSKLEFSFLSSVVSSELSEIHKTTPPRLDLGSIICRTEKQIEKYFLCLQASCDTVRGDEGHFFFIPLELTTGARPHQIVPYTDSGEVKFLSLKVPEKA